MRKPRYEQKSRVPFLRCLKCLEDTEKWARLCEELSSIQKESGGDSLRLPAGLFTAETVIDAPNAAEETEMETLKEMESNADIKEHLK